MCLRLAFELGEYGITVNSVAPGFTKTDMTMSRPAEELQAAIRHLESITSLRRVVEPEDIAEVVAFLASDRAGFITGQVISREPPTPLFFRPVKYLIGQTIKDWDKETDLV